MFLVLSPEELLIRDEDEAAAELVMENLAAAIAQLSQCLHKRLVLALRSSLRIRFSKIFCWFSS